MLVGFGADVNIADCHGFTPLHTASACGYLQMVSFLVIFGANVFAVTDDGDLPVDIAKDTSTASILTEQMLLRIHSKEYVNSWLIYHSKELLRIFFQTIVFLISSFVTFICSLLSNLQPDPDPKKSPPSDSHQKNSKAD